MNSDTSLGPPSPVQASRPITKGEFDSFLNNVLKDTPAFYQAEIKPILNELTEVQQKAVKIEKEIAEAREMKAQGAAIRAQGATMRARVQR